MYILLLNIKRNPCKCIAGTLFWGLWLYILTPFRTFDYPFFFGQAEEWGVACLALSGCLLAFVLSRCGKNEQLICRLTIVDMLMLLYLAYRLFRSDGQWREPDYIIQTYSLACLYAVVRMADMKIVRLLVPIIALSVVFRVFYDYFFSKEFWRGFAAMTGNFHNTGVWGGFVALAAVGILGYYIRESRKMTLKISLLAMLSFLIYMLICSHSRAAWIGAFAGATYLALHWLKKRYGKKVLLAVAAGTLLLSPLLYMAGGTLYDMKPTSATGRLYIWRIAAGMFAEKPYTGLGAGGFGREYMNRQDEYLSANPDSPFASIADETNVPFCEPLALAVEQGIVGIALLTLAILLCFKKPANRSEDARICMAILISLLLFAYFSYPFLFIEFCFLFVACIAVLSKYRRGYRLSLVVKGRLLFLPVLLSATVCCSSIFLTVDYSFGNMNIWYKGIIEFDANNPTRTLGLFEKIEPALGRNPQFLLSNAQMQAVGGDDNRR